MVGINGYASLTFWIKERSTRFMISWKDASVTAARATAISILMIVTAKVLVRLDLLLAANEGYVRYFLAAYAAIEILSWVFKHTAHQDRGHK
jgi:hypothetical protein